MRRVLWVVGLMLLFLKIDPRLVEPLVAHATEDRSQRETAPARPVAAGRGFEVELPEEELN